MEALLLSTASPHPLTDIGRDSSLSSLHSFTKSNDRIRTIPIRSVGVGKLSLSVVASVSKRQTGKTSSANVVVDGSAAAVTASKEGEVPDVSWKDVQWDSGSIGHRQPKPPPEEIDQTKQMKYLTEILGSKVYDVAVETPLQLAPLLSSQLGINLWLKREDTQQVMLGSFHNYFALLFFDFEN